jgi:hypothetical protein
LSYTAPANSIAVGDVFRFTGYATRVGTVSTSGILRIRIGTTTLTGAITSTLSASSPNAGTYLYTTFITCRTTGTSGTVGGAASSLMTTSSQAQNITSAVTVNTTVQNLVEVTFISGSASNTYTFEHAILEKLPS